MTYTAYYLYKQNPLFYNLARLFPTEPAPKRPYDWLSILVGIKFFPYQEDISKQFYYQRFINSVNQQIGQQRQLGYEIPTIPEMESEMGRPEKRKYETMIEKAISEKNTERQRLEKILAKYKEVTR